MCCWFDCWFLGFGLVYVVGVCLVVGFELADCVTWFADYMFEVIVLLGFFVYVCSLRACSCLFSLGICGFVLYCWCLTGLLCLLMLAFCLFYVMLFDCCMCLGNGFVGLLFSMLLVVLLCCFILVLVCCLVCLMIC